MDKVIRREEAHFWTLPANQSLGTADGAEVHIVFGLQIDFKFLIFQSFFHIELNLLMLEHFVMHKGVKEPDGLVLADDFIAGHHGVVHQDFSINFAMPWHRTDTDMVGKTGGDAIDVDDVGSFFNAFGSLFQGIALRFLAEQIGMGDFGRQTMEQNPGEFAMNLIDDVFDRLGKDLDAIEFLQKGNALC